jgi:hypothetical protein
MFYNRNNDNSTLLQLLMEAEFKVLLEAKSPAEIKAKLGIKKDAITDDDFSQILKASDNNRPLVVAMVKYYQETKNIRQIVAYTEKFVELETENFNFGKYHDFKGFTEALDAYAAIKVNKSDVKAFSIDQTPPDYQTKDGRYKVYEAHGRNDCIKYGKGYTFCISQIGSENMYGYYRRGQQSKYYFVFDTSLDSSHEKYITVIDSHPDGNFEFTHKSNDTLLTSSNYSYSLDVFFSTHKGLKELKDVFKPNPISDDERAKLERYQTLEDKQDELKDLDKNVLMDYIDHGFYIKDTILRSFNNQMFVQYINRNPTVQLATIAVRPPNVIARFFKVLHQNGLLVKKSEKYWFSLLGSVYSLIRNDIKLADLDRAGSMVRICLSADDVNLFLVDIKAIYDAEKFLPFFRALFLFTPKTEDQPYLKIENIGALIRFFKVKEEFHKNTFWPKIVRSASNYVKTSPVMGELLAMHDELAASSSDIMVDAYNRIADTKLDPVSGVEKFKKAIVTGELHRTVGRDIRNYKYEHPGIHTGTNDLDAMVYASLLAKDDGSESYSDGLFLEVIKEYPYIYLKYPELMKAPSFNKELLKPIARTMSGLESHVVKMIGSMVGIDIFTRGAASVNETELYLGNDVPKMARKIFIRSLITSDIARGNVHSILYNNKLSKENADKMKRVLLKIEKHKNRQETDLYQTDH